MIDPSQRISDDQLEAYLDAALEPRDRAVVDDAVGGSPELRRQVELQARIDAGLARLFAVEAPTEEQVAAVVASRSRGPRVATGRLGWAAAILAAAAAIGWLVATNFLTGTGGNDRHFVARPLADLYRDAVANGFEPGYQCEDADRFAATFERRQGIPLKLVRLPVGLRMFGLAYIGGLSPETTAMLAEADGQRVMVFVDRADLDRSDAAANAGKELRVFREVRDGLVFYEVTPLDRPRMIEYLVPAAAAGANELPSANDRRAN